MRKSFIFGILTFFNFILLGQKLPINPAYKPFYHGVASGDPLEDRVIIWTRITPDTQKTIMGSYILATDTALQNIVATDTFSTNASRDFTVKVDVMGLQNNTTYYYAFFALGKRSFVGRTKTTPSVKTNNLKDVIKLAVASCANYEAGYFNAYAALAERNDLNAVIHLGDYYYEYARGAHRNEELIDRKRKYIPSYMPVTKVDYRLRQSLYHLDKDLQRLHQQHPFIAIWDDHEIANNAYEEGSQNRKKLKVDYIKRKQAAKEAYFEWMPVRGTPDTAFYRTFSYGKLIDLFMLDTRLEGRQKQPLEFDTPDDSLNPRRMISQTQYNWLIDNLKHSSARWKVIGSQVIFSNVDLRVGSFLPRSRRVFRLFQNLFLDSWQGYKRQRNSILDTIQQNKINNVVIVSGDSHNSWAFDLNKMPIQYPFSMPKPSYLPQPNPYNPKTGEGYNPETGEGAVGVEFSTPSITSSSLSEVFSSSLISHWETHDTLPFVPLKNKSYYNPHLKYVNFKKHGYFVLDVRADKVQCDYFFVRTIVERTKAEYWAKGLSSNNNSNRITSGNTFRPAAPKTVQDIPAPLPRVASYFDIKNDIKN